MKSLMHEMKYRWRLECRTRLSGRLAPYPVLRIHKDVEVVVSALVGFDASFMLREPP